MSDESGPSRPRLRLLFGTGRRRNSDAHHAQPVAAGDHDTRIDGGRGGDGRAVARGALTARRLGKSAKAARALARFLKDHPDATVLRLVDGEPRIEKPVKDA